MVTHEVNSSHGAFILNDDGWVKITSLDDIDYSDIVRFDLTEWVLFHQTPMDGPRCFDILDLGYWSKDGTYEPPVLNWRTGEDHLDPNDEDSDGVPVRTLIFYGVPH